MKVFEFEKSLLDRLRESSNLLEVRGNDFIKASEIRHEWKIYAELKMEPAGWNAIWRINRATCESFDIKYPTVVFGMVNNVHFDEMEAEFSLIAVQDDNIHLREEQTVPLEDLWPTLQQENTELNAERTAEYLDEYRFFYRNIWMPWDDECDEDYDWCEKHLESRIRFCFDLKRNMSRPMADHIRKLLAEARYAADKRDIINIEMSEDETLEEDPIKVGELLRLQLRLVQIHNDIDLLMNPVLRRTYENLYITPRSDIDLVTGEKKVFIVTKPDTIVNHNQYLSKTRATLTDDQIVELSPSLTDGLKKCAAGDYVLLSVGLHEIKFFEPLISDGYIKAIGNNENKESVLDASKNAVIRCKEDDNVLLTFNGDFTLENITLDCRNVSLGIWCMRGTVTLKNCYLIGDATSATGNGIKVSPGAICILEDTSIEHFDTGILCASGGEVVLKNSHIDGCGVGLELSNNSKVQNSLTQIRNSSKYGTIFTSNIKNFIASGAKKTIVSDLVELQKFAKMANDSLKLTGEIIFKSNKVGNILVIDQSKLGSLSNSVYLEDNEEEENGFNGEVSSSSYQSSTASSLNSTRNGSVIVIE